MEIILSSKGPERIECDAVVLTFFQEEKPLKGISGLVDWRLHGFISRAMINQFITGRFGEKTLIASNNMLLAPMILCIGLGKVKQYSSSRLEEISTLILQTLHRIHVFTFTACLPGVETLGWDYSNAIESLINGTFAWAKSEGGGTAPFRLILREKKDRFDEIMIGLYRSRIKYKKSFEMAFHTNDKE
ncbi:MAG: hypothetical protein JRG73_01045 [Deltaproteobacteria bacterium]|nr:hypothetical protein [Deltaproteobacteria bacterium]MBW2305490.1 hypothetical protein [Deltaproteobacteria bacterium]